MTSQDQIKALAELDSWTDISQIANYPHTGTMPDGTFGKLLPDYLTSRDAIVPLIEKCWREGQFNSSLFYMGLKNYYPDIHLLFVTPSQLSEALLRATGKWK